MSRKQKCDSGLHEWITIDGQYHIPSIVHSKLILKKKSYQKCKHCGKIKLSGTTLIQSK